MGGNRGGKELQRLVSEVKKNLPRADMPLIEKAFFFAKAAHRNQLRKSKMPFFQHPFGAALILAGLGADSVTIAASLLHDVLEDTPISAAELRKKFGKSVSDVVEGVTALNEIAPGSPEESRIANLQNLLLAASKDERVIVVKLADRLHNLRTLQYMPLESRRRTAGEALEVYAPLSLKLGIWDLNSQLGDRAFRYLEPDVYLDLEKKIARRSRHLQREIDAMSAELRHALPGASFAKEHKTVYRIYEKMLKKSRGIDAVQDFAVLKIICGSIGDCYNALGVVHRRFIPLPNRVKDYIAAPLPNLYQSLHTMVIGPSGLPVKVYIRTREMDEIAGKGIIAYWRLKESSAGRLLRERVLQLGKIIRSRANKNPLEFMDALRADVLGGTVFVFAKGGKMVELPMQATPVDFAYAVAPKQAFRLWKAKVNGRLVPLGSKLENGDIVEITASKEIQANNSWLSFVKSYEAKDALKNFLKGNGEKKLVLDLSVIAGDKPGVLAAISRAISSAGINISGVSVTTLPNSLAQCLFNIKTADAPKLQKAVEGIKKVKHVKKAEILCSE